MAGILLSRGSLVQEFRLDSGGAFNKLLGGLDIANDGR